MRRRRHVLAAEFTTTPRTGARESLTATRCAHRDDSSAECRRRSSECESSPQIIVFDALAIR
jgi:hypothetical protein